MPPFGLDHPPSLFHLTCHAHDLEAARRFYGSVLGCAEVCGAPTWVEPFTTQDSGQVDDRSVPMPPFGVVLPLAAWQSLAERLRAAKLAFALSPQVRFEGQPGEPWTMFFGDPSGNPIDIKGLRSLDTACAS